MWKFIEYTNFIADLTSEYGYVADVQISQTEQGYDGYIIVRKIDELWVKINFLGSKVISAINLSNSEILADYYQGNQVLSLDARDAILISINSFESIPEGVLSNITASLVDRNFVVTFNDRALMDAVGFGPDYDYQIQVDISSRNVKYIDVAS